MIIQDFEPFNGQHCETTATGTLLKRLGVELSEPMLFGLGEGLGFIFWHMKTMSSPFLGGRIKPDALTANICQNLNLKLEVQETTSKKKAWEFVQKQVDLGTAVGLKLDAYHLDYFSNKIHFAGHYVAMFGYDQEYAYLVDTGQQGGKVKTSLPSLALARSEKGPMSSNNRSYIIRKNGQGYDLSKAIKSAIHRNANDYLNPPIKNIGYKGILKTSTEIKKWFERSQDIEGDFQTTAMLMERAGTGGALFRNLYRDFLKESHQILQIENLNSAYHEFATIADQWSTVSDLFYQAGETQEIRYINEASEILLNLSEQERKAMALLQKAGK
jgi:hypothetical protein